MQEKHVHKQGGGWDGQGKTEIIDTGNELGAEGDASQNGRLAAVGLLSLGHSRRGTLHAASATRRALCRVGPPVTVRETEAHRVSKSCPRHKILCGNLENMPQHLFYTLSCFGKGSWWGVGNQGSHGPICLPISSMSTPPTGSQFSVFAGASLL